LNATHSQITFSTFPKQIQTARDAPESKREPQKEDNSGRTKTPLPSGYLRMTQMTRVQENPGQVQINCSKIPIEFQLQ